MNNRIWRSLAVYALLIFVAISLVDLFAPKDQDVVLDYNRFLAHVESGKVSSVTIVDERDVTGTLDDGTAFRTIIPVDPALYTRLVESGATVKFERPPEPLWWVSLLSNMIPVLVMVAVFFYMLQQSQGGGKQVMQFGRSRARMQSDIHEKVTFADVAGCEEAKEELQEIVDFLKHSKKYVEMGARIPKASCFSAPRREDLYRPRSGGSRGTLPFNPRLRLCGDVCRRRRGPGERLV